MNVIETEFRNACRILFVRLGVKQEEVAERAGVSVSRLCRVLLAQTALDKRMLRSLAEGLRKHYASRYDIQHIQILGARRILSDLDLTDITELRPDEVDEWLREEKSFTERPTPIQRAARRRQMNTRKEGK